MVIFFFITVVVVVVVVGSVVLPESDYCHKEVLSGVSL